MKILYEETDECHGLSLPEIQTRLAGFGITSERKALYRDIAALNEFGFTVGKIAKRPVQYYLSDRLFERSELMLLIDAVQSSRSITQANSEALISKLRSLVSNDQAKDLCSQIHVSGRVKVQNDSVFDALDKQKEGFTSRLQNFKDFLKIGLKTPSRSSPQSLLIYRRRDRKKVPISAKIFTASSYAPPRP